MSDISIKGKSPILKYSKKAFVDKFVKKLAGGVEGKPHTSKEGIYAAAGRKIGRIASTGDFRSKKSSTKKK